MNRVFAITLMVFGFMTSMCRADCPESLLLFGDSYFDTGAGNAVAATIPVPLPNPTPPYFDNRHSNGPLWIDYTSANLGLPFVDYAVAGSETGSKNVNDPLANGLGGLFQQVTRFSATGSKISDDTIVIVDGAGNDFLALLANPKIIDQPLIELTIKNALTNLATVFQELQALGADKIVAWNLGDLGMLPLFNSSLPPFLPLQPLKSAFTQASVGFNANLPTQVVQKLNVFKKPQQIFIFDAFTAFNETAAALVAQGIDLSQIAYIANYGGPYTYTGNNPAHLAFYDQVHPTTLAWSIFATTISAYLDTLIEAPRFMASQADLALETAKAHRDLVENHFRTLNTERYIYDYWCGCCCDCDCGQNCVQVYVDGEGKWGETKTRCGAYGLDYNTGLGLIGVDLRVSQDLLLGASFTGQTTTAKVHEGRGHMKLVDYVPTIYASYFGPCYFIDLSSSLHCYDFKNLKRHTRFVGKTAKGHTDALGAETSLTLGYVSTCDCFTLMPLIGFDFEELTIQGYKEHHAGFLDMKIHRQHQRSFVARIGGQFFWKAFDGCFLPFGEVVYEYECLRNSKRIGPMFVHSNDHAQDFHHTGQPKRHVLKYSLGVDAKLCDCIVGNISYIGDTNFDNYNNAVRAQVDVAF